MVIHFLGEELEEYISGYREKILSFTTGATITYIFVQLLPEFQRIASESTEMIFAFPLLGFSSIHLVEKYIAKTGWPAEKMRKEYGEVHSVFLFLYHGAIGYLVASLLSASPASGLLFFLPVALHVAVSSLSMSELHETLSSNLGLKIVISIAPLLGVVFHSLDILSENLFEPLFGTVIGMFFYVVIRDSIPQGDRGKPLEYIAGLITYLAVIISVKTL